MPTPFVVPDIQQLATSGNLSPTVIGVGAVLAPPLGLYCVWQHPRWTVQQKWVWTGATALVLLVGLFLIPRIILALALLSGCALAFSLVCTNTALTVEQKRLWMSVSGLVCIVGLTVVYLAGHGSDGRGLSGESRGSGAADDREAHGQGENATAGSGLRDTAKGYTRKALEVTGWHLSQKVKPTVENSKEDFIQALGIIFGRTKVLVPALKDKNGEYLGFAGTCKGEEWEQVFGPPEPELGSRVNVGPGMTIYSRWRHDCADGTLFFSGSIQDGRSGKTQSYAIGVLHMRE